MYHILNRKTLAYLRVSTVEQDLDKNKAEILFFANEHNLGKVIFIEEKISGTVHWRKRELGSIIDSMVAGDNLIVSEFSRLGRSMLECMEVITFCLERKLNLFAIKGHWRLDNTIQSKIMGMIFSIASEIERDLISKRTSEALQARKQKGLSLGRPRGKGKSKLDGFKDEILALLNNGSSKVFVSKRYKTTVSNLHHWLKQNAYQVKENPSCPKFP